MSRSYRGDSTEELAFRRRFGHDVGVRVSMGMTLLVGCLLVTGVSGAQSQGGQALAWDYPDHQVAELDIVRFEIRFDARTPVTVGCTSSNQSRPMSLFRKRDFLPVSRLRRCV